MNYLAHAFLSGKDDELLIGNFIADAVKGRAVDDYSAGVKRGIVLHRLIDEYTDGHPIHRASREKLHERYGHYSGVMIDIFYDHFLAKNWTDYSDVPLLEFTERVYALMEENRDILPERIVYMLQYMVPQNWLLNYAQFEGIKKVLGGMAKRTTFESGMEHGLDELKQYYQDFGAEFATFFPELQNFVAHKINAIK